MIKYEEFLGANVLQEVFNLMNEVKKKNPLLTFALGGNRTTFFDEQVPPNRVEVKTSLRVYDSRDPDKELGGIGFDNDDKYWVRSRLICNDKYGHWNKTQHESKYSKHMKNIIKEATKYLKPFSFDEVKNEHEGMVDRVIQQRSGIVKNKANAKSRVDFIDIFPELLHMYNTGYIPKTPKMAEVIAYAVDNKAEIEKYYNYNPKKCMIWVRPNSVVYEIDKIANQVNSTDELPEDLRGKLFVLDVTDKGEFVEDVGIKQDTGIYWVLL